MGRLGSSGARGTGAAAGNLPCSKMKKCGRMDVLGKAGDTEIFAELHDTNMAEAKMNIRMDKYEKFIAGCHRKESE